MYIFACAESVRKHTSQSGPILATRRHLRLLAVFSVTGEARPPRGRCPGGRNIRGRPTYLRQQQLPVKCCAKSLPNSSDGELIGLGCFKADQNSTSFFFSSFLLSVCSPAVSKPKHIDREESGHTHSFLQSRYALPAGVRHVSIDLRMSLQPSEGRFLGQSRRTESSPGTLIYLPRSGAGIVCFGRRFPGKDREIRFGSSCLSGPPVSFRRAM
jgi:hypothetical protein